MTMLERRALELELLELKLTYSRRTKIIPKMECFREPARYKLAKGGRGSGKSVTIGKLLLEKANITPLRILCTREIQDSLEESVYALLVELIKDLRYPNWIIKKDAIESPSGAKFFFRGLKDLRAAENVKSMQSVDICWIEEAQNVSQESLDILIPTIRKEGSEIWASWNPTTETDPIETLEDKPGAMTVVVNWEDNPWFPEVLRIEKEDDYAKRPDEAEHIWGGLPRKQGERSIFSRVSIRNAMDISIEPEGGEQIGVDVARFGDDSTQMYRRKGIKVTAQKSMKKADTVQVADAIWDFAGHDYKILIVIDEGYNPGVIDVLKKYGANVEGVSFGGSAKDKDQFPNAVSEMWFTFPIADADIPDDQDLMTQLSDRRYTYDKKDRRMVESKDDYKKRHGGKSPDKADALLLTYYRPNVSTFDADFRNAFASARGR